MFYQGLQTSTSGDTAKQEAGELHQELQEQGVIQIAEIVLLREGRVDAPEKFNQCKFPHHLLSHAMISKKLGDLRLANCFFAVEIKILNFAGLRSRHRIFAKQELKQLGVLLDEDL